MHYIKQLRAKYVTLENTKDFIKDEFKYFPSKLEKLLIN